MVICKECIICGGLTKGKEGETGVYVCPDCKSAVVFVKKHKKDLFEAAINIKKSTTNW